MILGRQAFGFITILFLAGLCFITMLQNPHGKANRYFAAYNFCLLIWNSNDFLVFIRNVEIVKWLYRFSGIAGCMLIPCLMFFIYHTMGLVSNKRYFRIMIIFMTTGILFSILSPTPFVFNNILYTPYNAVIAEVPGPLYPAFIFYFLCGLFLSVAPLGLNLKNYVGFKKQQVQYLIAAAICGFIAASIFYVGILTIDLPWLYYPIEWLACLIFTFAIFKYDLFPAKVILRRMLLLLGILVGAVMTLIPVFYLYYKAIENGSFHFKSLFIFAFVVGAVFLGGGFIFSYLIRDYSLFQDTLKSEITHELKTPLAAIQSAQYILEGEIEKQTPNPEKIREYVTLIDRNTQRLQKFIGDVLDFNRIREGISIDTKSEVNLNEVVDDVLKDIPTLIKNFTFNSVPVPLVYGHYEGLKQVILNLLSNALKYCKEGPISLSISEDGVEFLIIVKDSGRGIASENLSQVFNPFFRLESPDQKVRSSGLGLSIVKKWIEFHNGRIWIESPGLNKGTTVSFTIPKYKA